MEQEPVQEIPGRWDIPYVYSVGETAGRFLQGLTERKLMGTHCPNCRRTFVPPRSFCEECFIPLKEWRTLGAEGTIEAATIVSEPFAGMPPPPYALGYVKLDGADTALGNFIRGIDFSDQARAARAIAIGTRVRVCFVGRPEGRITDFHYEPLR